MKHPANITALLLAAGRSSRFGSNKLLHPLGNDCVVLQAARNLASVCQHLLVVCNDTDVTQRLALAGYETIHCPRSDDGLSASIACGILASREADGWLIALGDMPWIEPRTIRRVRDSLLQHDGIVAPAYQGQRGHPVGFGANYGEQLQQLTGDAGAGRLVRQRDDVMLIPVDDPGVIRDIDHPADLLPD